MGGKAHLRSDLVRADVQLCVGDAAWYLSAIDTRLNGIGTASQQLCNRNSEDGQRSRKWHAFEWYRNNIPTVMQSDTRLNGIGKEKSDKEVAIDRMMIHKQRREITSTKY